MSKTSKHLRDCPAAGRAISSRECGEGRHSQFRCPAGCPYNPLSAANYDEFGEIERRVIRKTLDCFVRENRNDAALMENYRLAMERGIGDSTAFCLWHCFWLRDAQGRTMADRWEARRLDGLGNDERTLFAGHRRARPALFEIRRVVDETLAECVDLFSGERVAIADRSLAGSAVRFDAMFAWVAPEPHFSRFLGHAVVMPPVGLFTPKEVLLDAARHLGAPEEEEALLRWLAEHWRHVGRALGEIHKALRHAMLARIDAKYHSTDYKLVKDGRGLREKLKKSADVFAADPSEKERDAGFTDGFDWFESERPADPAQPDLPALARADRGLSGRPVIGRVLLGRDRVRIEASSTARYAQLRPKFERIAVGMVEFHREKLDDLAAQIAGPADYDAALVPPHFLEHAPRLEMANSRVEGPPGEDPKADAARLMERQRERWMDLQIPALEGRTPREAAAIPALREKLIRLVKGVVTRADRKSPEESEDATRLIATLGLHELAEPTPPVRPEIYKREDEPAESLLPDDPPLEPLDDDEIDERLGLFLATYPAEKQEELLDDFEDMAGDVLALYETLAVPLLNEGEQLTLFASLTHIWFVLVPGDAERLDVDPGRFGARLKSWLPKFVAGFEKDLGRRSAMLESFGESRQPGVALLATGTLLETDVKRSAKCIRAQSVPLLLAFIAAVTDELDCTVIEAR